MVRRAVGVMGDVGLMQEVSGASLIDLLPTTEKTMRRNLMRVIAALGMVLTLAGIANAAPLEVHSEGNTVAAGTYKLVRVYFSITLWGVPVFPNANGGMNPARVNTISSPDGQCGVQLEGPFALQQTYSPGVYYFNAFVRACETANVPHYLWLKGKTVFRIRAQAGVYQGETMTSIEAQ